MIGPSHDFPTPTTNKIIPSKITTFLHTRLAFEKVPQLGKISFFIFIFIFLSLFLEKRNPNPSFKSSQNAALTTPLSSS